MAKIFKTGHLLTVTKTQGKRANKATGEPAVAPEVEELPIGTTVSKSDFTKAEWDDYLARGTILAYESEDDADAEFYKQTVPSQQRKTEVEETPAALKERLLNEAKTLGISGVNKNYGVDKLTTLIEEHKANANKRADGTTASTQEGAGRANPSEGNGPAGGEAEGTADGAAAPQGQEGVEGEGTDDDADQIG